MRSQALPAASCCLLLRCVLTCKRFPQQAHHLAPRRHATRFIVRLCTIVDQLDARHLTVSQQKLCAKKMAGENRVRAHVRTSQRSEWQGRRGQRRRMG